MNAYQVYEEAIKPLPKRDRLTIARLILDEIAPDDARQAESGFDRLKRILPQIERITLTDQDLAGVVFTGRGK